LKHCKQLRRGQKKKCSRRPFFIYGGDYLAGVTKEQIAKAKEWDLLSYLQAYEPQELKKCGPREYCTRTHDS